MRKQRLNNLRNLVALGCVSICCVTLLGWLHSVQAANPHQLVAGVIKIDGIPIRNRAGVQVATKRTTLLWRYFDTNLDGQFIWGGQPLIGDDFRVVNRTIYTFTADFVPDPNWNGQMSTFHWGPLDPVTGLFRSTVFRGVRHDDFMPGLPIPGDFSVTQGMDGLPIPGITASGSLFIDSGDWDPNLGITPLAEPRWGIRYFITFAPGTPRVIPAGAFIFFDSQLDMQNLAPDTCENGWSEEDWITTGGVGGFTQPGPNTADPASLLLYPNLEAPPLLFVPAGHLCGAPIPVCGDGVCDPGETPCNCPQDCGPPPLTETNCSDGVDNDCDGLIDCDDPDCGADPACQPCLPKDSPCTSGAECCTGRCRDRDGVLVCR